jgi:hypothetical protein
MRINTSAVAQVRSKIMAFLDRAEEGSCAALLQQKLRRIASPRPSPEVKGELRATNREGRVAKGAAGPRNKPHGGEDMVATRKAGRAAAACGHRVFTNLRTTLAVRIKR